ncbi:MAG: methyltransferase domain-containing protein, partial [Candidatus Dormibacteraeota bacterium]|nr:methyltransferase domain-containing protein [Candidatus Dormibacteraeota bacterium]
WSTAAGLGSPIPRSLPRYEQAAARTPPEDGPPARPRTGRRRGRELLGDLGLEMAAGGPLSEQGAVLWATIPAECLDSALPRLVRLGYTEAVDLLVSEGEREWSGRPSGRPLRWRGRPHRLLRLWEEDPERLRELAPDRREFLLETGDGLVRRVRGYRGGREATAHRALPVPDARLLVNLVAASTPGLLLDPFAGAGGVVIEALASGWRVISADVDPALRHGLSHLAARHLVADARHLPLAGASVDAIATEPPYQEETGGLVAESLAELRRVLRPGGRISMLCAAWQAPALTLAAAELGLTTELDAPVDRKGLAVRVLAWRAG